jgi:hypothetical protein
MVETGTFLRLFFCTFVRFLGSPLTKLGITKLFGKKLTWIREKHKNLEGC